MKREFILCGLPFRGDKKVSPPDNEEIQRRVDVTVASLVGGLNRDKSP
jgi:hypothetical protein